MGSLYFRNAMPYLNWKTSFWEKLLWTTLYNELFVEHQKQGRPGLKYGFIDPWTYWGSWIPLRNMITYHLFAYLNNTPHNRLV